MLFPFMSPLLFSFRNSSDDNACIRCSRDSLSAYMGLHVSMICSWVSSFTAAISPLFPNFLRPGLRLYWVIRYPHTFSSSSNVVVIASSALWMVSFIKGFAELEEVVPSICSPFGTLTRQLAFVILPCARVVPSWRKATRGANWSYG
jgi:hypothetical protein